MRFTETAPGQFIADSRPVLICTSRLDRSVHAAISQLADPAAVAVMSDARRRELSECIGRSRAVVADLS